MKKKVFVSSTVYDLIDARAELESHIREIGLDPILSDSATSDFVVLPDRNSIETCLVNVRRSDYIIVLLSRRYGPSLEKAGYPDLSATHLEYRCAKESNIPILFYVRDRLLSEYNTWRSNSDGPFHWAEGVTDRRLFTLIDEHKPLKINTPQSNWCDSFTSTRDLRTLVSRDLRLPSSHALLDRAVRDNKIPIFDGDVTAEPHKPSEDKVYARFRFVNVGTVPAYNVNFQWDDNRFTPPPVLPVVAPGRHIFQGVPFDAPTFNCDATIFYQSPEGHGIRDTFHAYVKTEDRSTSTRIWLMKRLFFPGDSVPLTIEEV